MKLHLSNKLTVGGINLGVVAILLALAILLGIVNNLRQGEDTRVNWFGAASDAQEVEP